ncbi:hypothetical protein GGD55_005745 [Rhizobium giardinii]|uniref:Uncharacterized protein n=1 Tax=Rhizobium giardinii TaxID=56731 RepID=A0A7W8UGM3_9HYPH|nr:hypothetical protein [Rhizobium giardinii]
MAWSGAMPAKAHGCGPGSTVRPEFAGGIYRRCPNCCDRSHSRADGSHPQCQGPRGHRRDHHRSLAWMISLRAFRGENPRGYVPVVRDDEHPSGEDRPAEMKILAECFASIQPGDSTALLPHAPAEVVQFCIAWKGYSQRAASNPDLWESHSLAAQRRARSLCQLARRISHRSYHQIDFRLTVCGIGRMPV